MNLRTVKRPRRKSSKRPADFMIPVYRELINVHESLGGLHGQATLKTSTPMCRFKKKDKR
jgi:hypothetical protein